MNRQISNFSNNDEGSLEIHEDRPSVYKTDTLNLASEDGVQ